MSHMAGPLRGLPATPPSRRNPVPPLLQITDVADVGRVLDCAQLQRRRQVQHLVRRYILQIEVGCTDDNCTTPTCLSCSKRSLTKPFRAPTHLTACALAHYLASKHDPYSSLCPHPPKLGVSEAFECPDTDSPPPHLAAFRRSKKDAKSLGQNLYDTITLTDFLTEHIPSPASIFAKLVSPGLPRQNSMDTVQARTLDVNTASPTSSPTSPSRHSQSSREALSSPLVPAQVLSNRERIHKFRHLPDNIGIGRPSSKASKSARLDGTDETTFGSKLDMPTFRPRDGTTSCPRASRVPLPAPPGQGSGLEVAPGLNSNIMQLLKMQGRWDPEDPDYSPSPHFLLHFERDRDGNIIPVEPFVYRSLFFTLSDPAILLVSFLKPDNKGFEDSPLPHLDSNGMVHVFQGWSFLNNGSLIFDSLCIAVESLFTPPPEISAQKGLRKASRKTHSIENDSKVSSGHQGTAGRHLSDKEAAHIIIICIHALTSFVSVGTPQSWSQLRNLRSWGIIFPPSSGNASEDPWMDIVDELEDEPALRLADRLLRGIGTRMCFANILKALGHESRPHHLVDLITAHLSKVEREALDKRSDINISRWTDYASKVPHRKRDHLDTTNDPGWTVTATFMEILRTIMLKNWDGKAEVNKWSSVGVAIVIFDKFHRDANQLNLRPHMFHMPYLDDRLHKVNEAVEFMKRGEHPNSFHLFDFPCLFPAKRLVALFRTINYSIMFQDLKNHLETHRLIEKHGKLLTLGVVFLRVRLSERLEITLNPTFSLGASREHVLEETLNRLWGQERRSLLKPLKVALGHDAGEVGQDEGGVTSEFFRIVINQAMQPSTGMFTATEENSNMTWFQPASLEPAWKFEMMGLVFSLAVYNGSTIPVNFPLALYHYLLVPDHRLGPIGHNVEFIRDGWPVDAQSREKILSYKGDVANLSLSYIFSFKAFGWTIEVDMQAHEDRLWPADHENSVQTPVGGELGAMLWPPNTPLPALGSLAWGHPVFRNERERIQEGGFATSPSTSDDSPPVTTANRQKFVADYIHWLTYRSVAPQLEAFRKGFRTCLEPKSLALFTPHTLQSLVEGLHRIDVADFKAHVKYGAPYNASHPTILLFWDVVEAYSQAELKMLVNFMTANERVPVAGFASVGIKIEYQADTNLFPSSATCFGMVKLPAYGSREVLKERLDVAIRCEEFGVA